MTQSLKQGSSIGLISSSPVTSECCCSVRNHPVCSLYFVTNSCVAFLCDKLMCCQLSAITECSAALLMLLGLSMLLILLGLLTHLNALHAKLWWWCSGLHMGQFCLGPCKRQPYETDIRIPMLLVGPSVPAASITAVAGNYLTTCVHCSNCREHSTWCLFLSPYMVFIPTSFTTVTPTNMSHASSVRVL